MQTAHYSVAIPPSFFVSTDPALLDVDAVHAFLSKEAYWCLGIPRGIVERSIKHSMCFGLYDEASPRGDGGASLVGFARIISDRATYAYLCDVFVLPAWRGRDLSKAMLKAVFAHPELQGLRRTCLMTRDAHGLYEQLGFGYLADPRRYMERTVPNIYQRSAGA